MEIDYYVFEDLRAILCVPGPVLGAEDIGRYFSSVTADPRIPPGSVEHVDLTRTNRFEVTYETFYPLGELYAGILQKGIIRRVVFYVANPLQYGMSKIFAGVISSPRVESEITYDRTELDRLYRRAAAMDEED